MSNSKPYPKKYVVFAILILAISMATISVLGKNFERISISQDTAQQVVSEKLPLTKSVDIIPLVKADFTISDISIDFRDDGQLGIIANADVASRLGTATIRAKAVGVPTFESSNSSFYFKPSQVEFEQFDFSSSTGKNMDDAGHFIKGVIDTQLNGEDKAASKLKKLAARIGGKEAEQVVEAKIEQAREKTENIDAEEITKKIKAESITLVSDAISTYLKHRPIKKLEGAKGFVISMAIKKITVANNELIIEFSLLRLTANLIIFALIAIAIAIALATSPFWIEAIVILAP